MNRQKAKRLVIGLVLLVLGVLWLGNALSFWNFSVLFPGWWAALLMICFLISVISDGPNVGNVFCMLIFGAVVLKCNGIIPASVNIWLVALALAVILFGGKIIFNAFRGPSRAVSSSSDGSAFSSESESTSDHGANYIFTGETLRFAGQTIQDLSYSVSFGSLTLDFTDAVFAEKAKLAVAANFGEAKVILPVGVRAESVNSAAFASIRNASSGSESVKMKLDCTFGAISVMNRH